MGGVYTPQQFIGKLGELNASVGQVPRTGVEAGSLIVKSSILAITPERLSGVGRRGGTRRGAKLGVRYHVRDQGDEAVSWIKATGPFPLIERDVPAHVIPRATTRAAIFAVIPNATTGDGVFSSVNHPGTKGKHPFERGSIQAMPAVTRMFEAQNLAAIGRVF